MSGLLLLICNSRSATISIHRLMDGSSNAELLQTVDLPVERGENSASPMVLSRDERLLYLPWRGETKSMMTFAFDKAAPSLALVDQQVIEDDVCYLTLDRAGGHLLGAGGEHLVSYLLGSDGLPLKRKARVHLGPLAHCIIEDGQGHAWATSCQGGFLQALEYHSGSLTLQQNMDQPLGSGPRHLCLSPDGRRLYLVTQESGEVVVFDTDGLRELQRLPMQDEPTSPMGGDIVVTGDGRFVYASERGGDSVVGFAVDPGSGMLLRVSSVEVPNYPRALAVYATYLFALGFRGHRAAVFTIRDDGNLKELTSFATGERPSWVIAVDSP